MSDTSDNLDLSSESEFDKCQICYCGFVPSEKYSRVEKIDASISPEEFYKNYVKVRKPVIISSLSRYYDKEFQIHKWNSDYLVEKAGQCTVMVEKLQHGQYQKYGYEVSKVAMKYGEFIDGISKKVDRCYMTTQEFDKDDKDLDDNGMSKKLYLEPLNHLRGDFPIRPTIAGHMVPHLISLWQGFSESGSSSGLHHDFEDNLYILIQGRKRFRLFPPSCVESLKTSGRPLMVFKNGLIAYEDDSRPGLVTVQSDGVPLCFLAKQRLREATEKYDDAKKSLDGVKKSRTLVKKRREMIAKLKQNMKLAKEEIEEAMQDIMLYGNENGDDISGGEEEGEDCFSKEDSILKDDGDISGPIPPYHFCGIHLPVGSDVPSEIFEAIGASEDARDMKCLIAELEEGDSLYLPASWFHEVTSFSLQGSHHLALNYWFYPPNGTSFTHPYEDNFWVKHFESVSKRNSS